MFDLLGQSFEELPLVELLFGGEFGDLSLPVLDDKEVLAEDGDLFSWEHGLGVTQAGLRGEFDADPLVYEVDGVSFGLVDGEGDDGAIEEDKVVLVYGLTVEGALDFH